MKRLFVAILVVVMIFCFCACNGVKKDPNAPNPFDFEGNAVACEVVLDGYYTDELWSSPNCVTVQFATSTVSIVRRPEAIYFFYKVKDLTPYSYVGVGEAEEVTHSDSVEFYFDSKLTRTDAPASNNYQVNIGRDSRTRICSGKDWTPWMALYMFEVREGFDEEQDYYYVEIMLPVAQMNIGAEDAVGIAFGQVDRFTAENIDLENYYTWTGLTVNGQFCDPQIPSTYMVLTANGSRLYSYEEYKAMQTGN